VGDSPCLGESGAAIANAEPVHVCIAYLFEITLEIAIGKLKIDLAALTEALRADGVQTLPIREHHLPAQLTVPPLHRDPFDRLLVAQAMTATLRVVSDDRHLAAYPIDMIRCG